jgi:hypothetical protein
MLIGPEIGRLLDEVESMERSLDPDSDDAGLLRFERREHARTTPGRVIHRDIMIDQISVTLTSRSVATTPGGEERVDVEQTGTASVQAARPRRRPLRKYDDDAAGAPERWEALAEARDAAGACALRESSETVTSSSRGASEVNRDQSFEGCAEPSTPKSPNRPSERRHQDGCRPSVESRRVLRRGLRSGLAPLAAEGGRSAFGA